MPGPETLDKTLTFRLPQSLRDAIREEATTQGMTEGELIRVVLSGFIAHIDKENK